MSGSTGIDNVSAPGGGRIGLVHCPGTGALGPLLGDPADILDEELVNLRQWGAEALVTLMERHEIRTLGLEMIGERAGMMGLRWWHLPIVDGCAPEQAFEAQWDETGAALHAILDADGRVVVHCRAGLGRSGTIAARLLIERGVEPDQAIAAVRRARPGAIENVEQVLWLRQLGAR